MHTRLAIFDPRARRTTKSELSFFSFLDNDKPTNHQHNGPLIVSAPHTCIAKSLLTTCRSVPTQNDIAVPESVLKKQKAGQKVTDNKAADLQKKREVR